jgi:hypothetical protein
MDVCHKLKTLKNTQERFLMHSVIRKKTKDVLPFWACHTFFASGAGAQVALQPLKYIQILWGLKI